MTIHIYMYIFCVPKAECYIKLKYYINMKCKSHTVN